jgi:tetratricopeptide (TPR) repeat protein
VLLAEGQNQTAITNFIVALQLEPDWSEALQNLARAYAAAGNQSNAISSAGLALKMAQTNHDEALTKQIAGELKSYQTSLNTQPSASPNPY